MTKTEDSTFFRNVWGQKSTVPWEGRAHCSIVRVAKRREGLGGQHLADFATLPHAVGKGGRA